MSSKALNPRQFFHTSDLEFQPGDILEPPSVTGHKSKWGEAPGYSPDHVYLSGRDSDPMTWSNFGKHSYEVQPIGRVHRDPEWTKVKDHYIKEEGFLPEEVPGFHSFIAPKAKVIKKI